ncbi:MAG TPA: hypothetical protein VGI06_10210 [Acidimicrobiales bacterium]
MRRSAVTALILALCLVLLASTPASAHPGATVFEITVGAPTSISILVPADYGQPITEVDIADAPGFELQGGETPGPPWTMARRGETLVFTGGSIPVNDPATLFTVRGVAPVKGELVFAVTTHSPDGTVMHYTGGPGTPDQGAVVYAGITPPFPGHHRFPWTTVAGVVILVAGAAGTGRLLLRRSG